MAACTKWRLLVFVFLVLSVNRAKSSQEIMKKLTMGFTKVFEQCKTEMGLGDHVMQEMYNFWKEEYELVHRDTGCAIMCIATKLDLVQEDALHHGKAIEFAIKHGADPDTAKQLVTMIHECEKKFASISDDCNKVLEVSKCFRTKIHELKWAPDMETLLKELMTEI